MPTLIFAHGNTLKHEGAMEQCWFLYQKMRCCPGKKRLVFWSWPAQIAIKRPLLRPRKLIMANLRIKFVYSEYQGYYMAKLVQRMSMTQRVTVGGHSYGAIHASVGGPLPGRRRAARSDARRRRGRRAAEPPRRQHLGRLRQRCDDARLPATASRSSRPRRCSSPATPATKRSTTGRTCRSAAARRIGVTGINANRLGQYRDKLCQITMTADVGRSHYIEPHMDSARLVNAAVLLRVPRVHGVHRRLGDGERRRRAAGDAADHRRGSGDGARPTPTSSEERGARSRRGVSFVR